MRDPLDEFQHGDDRVTEQGVDILAGARARCLEAGIEPAELGNLFMQEALLAWMVDGMSEHDIHVRIRELVGKDLRSWFYNARLVTGQCDCVREVHFESLDELKSLFTGRESPGGPSQPPGQRS